MSKFCTKCGATLEDNAAFCTSCGTKFEAVAQPQAAPAQAPASSGESILDKVKANANVESLKKLQSDPNFTKYVGIGAVAVVVLILIIILVNVIGSGYEKPIDKFLKGIEKEDGEIIMEAFHEQELKSEKKDMEWTSKEQKDSYESMAKLNYAMYEAEFGKKLSISWKEVDREKLDDDDLKEYEDTLEEMWDEKGLDVSKGYEVDVEIKVKGKDDKDELDGSFVVLKVDGDWCLYANSIDLGLSLDSLDDLDLGDLGDLDDLLGDLDF